MKKTLLVLLFLIFANVFSQVAYKYYEVPSGTTSNLNDIRYLYFGTYNSYNFICGENGTLLKIKNADSLVFNVQSNTTANLNGIIKYINSSYLFPYFIFGDNGFVLKIANNSSNWLQQYTGYTENINSGIFMMAYPLKYKSIAVGSNGLIIKRKYYPYSDTNWTRIQSGTTNELKSINAYTTYSVKVFIAGCNGTILHSIDTGNTWTQMVSGTTANLNNIFFRSLDTGFAVGDSGIILKTTNGGLNWNQKNKATLNNLNCIAYLDDSNICITGNKVVLFSTDKGENWYTDYSAPKYNFNSVSYLYSDFYQKYIPFFAGDSGKIYKRMLDTFFHHNININLNGNNIESFFTKRGLFDRLNNSGFFWPKGTYKTAIYSAGLCIGGFVNGELREAMGSYYGEYSPGYCENGDFKTNYNFKYYKISRGDNAQNNWDWANWGLMVLYGAPFIDVNNNGVYEPAIDTPGVKNAAQTIFYCMTDADSMSHNFSEGFGGGTKPLGAEVHMTAWVYDISGLENVQFLNFAVINKSKSSWKRTYIGIFCDPDLGSGNDDLIACDTGLQFAYCYNALPNDPIYGAIPPAVGITLLSGLVNKNISPVKKYGMTTFSSPLKYGNQCDQEPYNSPLGAYRFLSGYKRDSTCWLDPTFTPPKKTKLCYPGEPWGNGWNEQTGSIRNCGLDSTGPVVANEGFDRKMLFASGDEAIEVAPGDTQKIVIAQMIDKGSSHINSITILKRLCATVRSFYNENFPFVINPIPVVEYPQVFMLDQNYPNPFNATTRIKFRIPKINGTVTGTVKVVLKVYDLLGREVQTLFNGDLSAKDYEITFDGKSFASGMYIYKLIAGEYVSVKRMVLIK